MALYACAGCLFFSAKIIAAAWLFPFLRIGRIDGKTGQAALCLRRRDFTVALVGGSNLGKCKQKKKKDGNKRPEKGGRHGMGLFVKESPCHPT